MISDEDDFDRSFLGCRASTGADRHHELSMGAFRAWQLAAVYPRVKIFTVIRRIAKMQALTGADNNQLRGHSAYAMLHPRLADA